MKNYRREIVLSIILVLIFVGVLFLLANNTPQTLLPISIAILTLLLGIVTLIWQAINKSRNIRNSAPAEDEFTKLVKVYAGNQAFHYSIYLWLIIFAFNSSFTKHETMLGIGILGSALIYGISLLYFNMTGEFSEK